MTTQQRGIVGTVVLVACLWGLVRPAGAAVEYTVTDLGASNGMVGSINEMGQVSGYTETPDGRTTRMFGPQDRFPCWGRWWGTTMRRH